VIELNGREYREQLPGVKRGMLKACYHNAVVLALAHPRKYTYVEGLAMPAGLFPVEHAWCVDRAGRVAETTWEKPAEYFGVPVTLPAILSAAQMTDYYGGLFVCCGYWDKVLEILRGSGLKMKYRRRGLLHPRMEKVG
jgi:hypothetical protein